MKVTQALLLAFATCSLVAAQNNNRKGGGQGGNNGATTTAAAAASSTTDTAVATSAAADTGNTGNAGGNGAGADTGNTGDNGNAGGNNAATGQGDNCLVQDNIQAASDSTGAANAGKGQSDSVTDPANFINFCTGKTKTNGLQVKGGSCNGIVMGDIPSTGNMISSIITFPGPGDTVQANTDFSISVQVDNLNAGTFTNPDTTYYSAPQALAGGKIIGHTHVTVQDLGGDIATQKPPNPGTFTFFKGINDAGNGNGGLQAAVAGGLPPGTYRVCTMTSAANHQPVIMPVAQRGAQDDCNKFTVTADGKAAGDNAGGNAAGDNAGGNAAGDNAGGNAGGNAAGDNAGGNAGAGNGTDTGAGAGTGNAGNGGAAATTSAADATATDATGNAGVSTTTSAATGGSTATGGNGGNGGNGGGRGGRSGGRRGRYFARREFVA